MWRKLGVIFDCHHAQLPTPCILKDKIRVFYASRKQNISYINFFDMTYDFEIKEVEENVVVPGDRGRFDDSGVMPSCIQQKDHQYMLYYSGWNLSKGKVPYGHGIGVAISEDAKVFKKIGPIIDRSIANPYLSNSLFVNKEIGLYCHGTGWMGDIPTYNIYKCKSSDGINWHSFKHFIGSEEDIISRPCLHDDIVLFSMKTKENNYQICSWEKNKLQKSILPPSEVGWDSEMTCYPYVININGNVYMLYNGNGYGKTGIGLAIWE